ncbi:hypothetical protein BJ170DRAFT_683001 [Xylariales sp. AK1849]|nr:hypothetical protein BJ170DRAFT_683001 [Xylariales sp. AK1849]
MTASAQHRGMKLREIVMQCKYWPGSVEWFVSTAHQDVCHVEEVKFDKAGCRMETVYPHYEPLRERNTQAFVTGDKLTFETVTFAAWIDVARALLAGLEGIMGAAGTETEREGEDARRRGGLEVY